MPTYERKHEPRTVDPREHWENWRTYGVVFGDDPKTLEEKLQRLLDATRRIERDERAYRMSRFDDAAQA